MQNSTAPSPDSNYPNMPSEEYTYTEVYVNDEALDMLNTNGMQINYHKNGSLSGTIHVPEGQMILTSIPYDAGWTIKIDNQKVPVECFADTFLAVRADTGDHTISFTYVSPGFLPGVILFCFALGICILYLHRGRSTDNGNPDTPSVV